MIVLRIAGGIREHFGIRAPEWIMTLALFAWSGMLLISPRLFETSPEFSILASYGNEFLWGNVCLTAALIRLCALTVNGTFKQFRYSPHFRAGASFVSCVFWGQITLGVLAAQLVSGVGGTGIVTYSIFITFEMWNLFRAWADVGAVLRRH